MSTVRETDAHAGVLSSTSGVTVLQCLLQNESVETLDGDPATSTSKNEDQLIFIYPCKKPGCKKLYMNAQHLKEHEKFHTAAVMSRCERPQDDDGADSSDVAGSKKRSGLQFLLQNEDVLYGDEDSMSDIVLTEEIVEEVYVVNENSKVLRLPDDSIESNRWTGTGCRKLQPRDETMEYTNNSVEEDSSDYRESNQFEEASSSTIEGECKQRISSSMERNFVCTWPGCIKTYIKSSHLNVHYRKHTGELPFGCDWPGCNQVFSRSDTLTRHQVTHTLTRNFSCRWCVKRFLRRDHLQAHLRMHNLPSSEYRMFFPDEEKSKSIPEVPPTIEALPSGAVKKQRPSKHTTKTPATGQDRPRNFHCDYEGCGKTYTRMNHLKAHELLHSGTLPFCCPWEKCGEAFARSFELSRHRRKHTGERKFVCHICQQAFMRSDHLSSHVKRHTFLTVKADSREPDMKIKLKVK